MNKNLLNKTEQLLGSSSIRELLFKDYADIDIADSKSRLILHNVRGSARLMKGLVVTPSDVHRLRNQVSRYSFEK